MNRKELFDEKEIQFFSNFLLVKKTFCKSYSKNFFEKEYFYSYVYVLLKKILLFKSTIKELVCSLKEEEKKSTDYKKSKHCFAVNNNVKQKKIIKMKKLKKKFLILD